MSFFFQDIFGGAGGFPGGHPGAHGHHHGHPGHDESDEEEVDTTKFYEVLGVEKTATAEELSRAYKKKARQLHPDRHPDDRDQYLEKFQDLQKAWDFLKDPQKRKLYDKYGEKGAKRGGPSGGGGDIFSQFFGDRGAREDAGPKKSPSIKQVIDVQLEDFYKGAHKKLRVQRYTSAQGSSACDKCDGEGTVTMVQRMGGVMFQQRRQCNACDGQGYKLQLERAVVDVHIPIGGRHGETITVANEGHKYPDHAPGDITVQMRMKPHDVYTRQGADLGMNHTLSLKEAMCGYKIRVEHVRGCTLVIDSQPGEIVQPGDLKRVFNYGMPQRFAAHVQGHLYIVMDVELPLFKQLSPKAFKHLQQILPNQQIAQDCSDDEEESKENVKAEPAKAQQKNKGKKQKNKGKKNKKNKHYNHPEVAQVDDDEWIEEVSCQAVDGRPKATPYAARGAYHDDDDEDGQGVQCHQM